MNYEMFASSEIFPKSYQLITWASAISCVNNGIERTAVSLKHTVSVKLEEIDGVTTP